MAKIVFILSSLQHVYVSGDWVGGEGLGMGQIPGDLEFIYSDKLISMEKRGGGGAAL